jgi:hypothetical protein
MKSILIMILSLALAGIALAGDPPTAEQLAGAKYLGSRGCRPCHMSRAQGRMAKIWSDSPHAAAYDTLGTPRGLEVAQANGVGNPQTDDKCLRCHATAFGVEDSRRARRFGLEDGVSCESCHGPGQYYKKRGIMCQIVAGTLEGASVGLLAPDEEACVQCHNDQSPTWPGSFNFEEMLAKIAHPIPAARKQKITDEGCAPSRRR